MNPLRPLLLSLCLLTACASEPDNAPDQAPDAAPDLPRDVEDSAPDLTEDMSEDMPSDMGSTQQPLPDLDALAACAPYVKPGPYKAGVTTIMVGGSPVEIWYPSDVSGPADIYDLRAWLPDDYNAAIAQDAPTTYTTTASRDVPASADGPFPVVLFSHGFAAYRLQSSFLTAHLATWGYVVVAPDHPERGLKQVLTDLASVTPGDGRDVIALKAGYEAALLASATPGDKLEGKLDASKLALSGHSAGGAASIALAADAALTDKLKLVLAYTPAVNADTALISPELVAISGTRDTVTSASSIRGYINRAANPRRYIAIKDAGHLAPSDLCVIGRERGGILKIAQDSGISINTLLRSLANNGCTQRDLRVERAWPILTHMSVAHLRRAFGQPLDEAAIGQPALDCFDPLIADHIEAD